MNKVSLKIKDLLTLTEDSTRSESKSKEPKTGTKGTGEKEDEDTASLENIRQCIISQYVITYCINNIVSGQTVSAVSSV